MSNPVLKMAVAYAKCGWNVLPVKGKKPSIDDDWPHRATSTPDEVERLFTRFGYNGVGVLLGASSGIVDLEIDDPKGEETLRWLFGGNVPATLTFSGSSD